MLGMTPAPLAILRGILVVSCGAGGSDSGGLIVATPNPPPVTVSIEE